MSRTFNAMPPEEQREYTVWSQILADHTNSKETLANAKQNLDRLDWKGVGEDLREQISDVRKAVELLTTEAAESSPATRMSKTMKERFSVIDARLDMLGEKVQGVGSEDIAGYVRDEIETQIGLAAVQAVANAVTEVMGDTKIVRRREENEPIVLTGPQAIFAADHLSGWSEPNPEPNPEPNSEPNSEPDVG